MKPRAGRGLPGLSQTTVARNDRAALSFTLLFIALLAAFALSLNQAVPSSALNALFTNLN